VLASIGALGIVIFAVVIVAAVGIVLLISRPSPR
jgi:hypothetical protein